MPERANRPPWTRHVVRRTDHVRTTWTFRVLAPSVAIAVLWLTSAWWTVGVARSLVCDSSPARSDAILIENFGFDYFVFERASQLRRAGLAGRVIVPIPFDSNSSEPNDVALGGAQLMAGIARLGPFEIVPTRETEPISLSVARDVRRFAEREGIRSVLVVTPLFRSRRSALVYGAVLRETGATVTCQPAKGLHQVDTWTQSWHGVEDVVEQWIKLQYYRLYVLPFRLQKREPA